MTPLSSCKFFAIPRDDRIKKSKALSVKLIETSTAFSRLSLQDLIPIPTKIYSFTLPTPGSFLTGSLAIKSIIAGTVFSK